MKKVIYNIIKEEDGQGMVEYGIIIAGIAIVVIVAIWALGPTIAKFFSDTDTTLKAKQGS